MDLLSVEAKSLKALASPSGNTSYDRTVKPPDVTAGKTLEEASKMSATVNNSRRNSACSAISLTTTGNWIPTPLNKGRFPNPWQEVWQTHLILVCVSQVLMCSLQVRQTSPEWDAFDHQSQILELHTLHGKFLFLLVQRVFNPFLTEGVLSKCDTNEQPNGVWITDGPLECRDKFAQGRCFSIRNPLFWPHSQDSRS